MQHKHHHPFPRSCSTWHRILISRAVIARSTSSLSLTAIFNSSPYPTWRQMFEPLISFHDLKSVWKECRMILTWNRCLNHTFRSYNLKQVHSRGSRCPLQVPQNVPRVRRKIGSWRQQTRLTLKNAVPVRLNQLGQDDVNNCVACVACLAHLAQSQWKLFAV